MNSIINHLNQMEVLEEVLKCYTSHYRCLFSSKRAKENKTEKY